MYLEKLDNFSKRIYEKFIEMSDEVKVVDGKNHLIIITCDATSMTLYFNKKNGSVEQDTVRKTLAAEMINALGGVDDITAEKILATMYLDAYYEKYGIISQRDQELEER